MTHTTTTPTILRRLKAFLRACLVTFLMVPGSGIALFATACADLEVPHAEPSDAHSDTSLGVLLAPETSLEVSELSEPAASAQVEPPLVTLLPLNDPLPAPSEPVAESFEPEVDTVSDRQGLSVVEATLARGVSERQPIGPTHHFSVGEVAWAWVAMGNRGEEASMTMLWFRDDALRSRLDLKVGTSPRWRTWSRRTLRSSDIGRWRVEVQSAEGEVLHTLRFEVSAPSKDLSAFEADLDGC